MMSLDPWRVIATDSYGDVVIPAPVWGHPFYREVPSWIHYGEGNGTSRLLFDGAFIGADVPASPPERGKLATDIAPVVAPATGPITVKKELDDKQVLHVEICVDGKCYRSSTDLAPAIQMVMAKLAEWHRGMHTNGGVSPTAVVGSVAEQVRAAGDAMADMLVDRHRTVAVSGFLDDIGNFVKGIPVVGDVFKGAGETVKALSGPLKAAAPLVATAFGGPAAGAAASQFAGSIIDSLAGGKDTPQKVAAEQQAQVDPVVARKLATAKNAVAHTLAAHHVHRTATKAAQGHPGAQQDINRLVQDAEKGDRVAQVVTPLVQSGFAQELLKRAAGGAAGGGGGLDLSSLASLFGGGGGAVGVWPQPTVGGWYDVAAVIGACPCQH